MQQLPQVQQSITSQPSSLQSQPQLSQHPQHPQIQSQPQHPQSQPQLAQPQHSQLQSISQHSSLSQTTPHPPNNPQQPSQQPVKQDPVVGEKREREETSGGGVSLPMAGEPAFKKSRTDPLPARVGECKKLLRSLMKHKYGWPFNQPVDPIALGIPDYFDIIKHPMDLGTIKENLDSNAYSYLEEFKADMDLVWANALTYNQPGSDIVIMAKDLRDLANKKWASMLRKWNSGGSRGNGQKFETAASPKESRKKGASGAPVMTFEEKRQLCILVNNLELKYLGRVVQIVHNALDNLPQSDQNSEEVEVNIETLDEATLRELYEYAKEVSQVEGLKK